MYHLSEYSSLKGLLIQKKVFRAAKAQSQIYLEYYLYDVAMAKLNQEKTGRIVQGILSLGSVDVPVSRSVCTK